MMKRIVKEDILKSDYTAIADNYGNKISYRELTEKASELENSMEERSLIFLLCDHEMETAEFLYEVLYLNRVPLLLPEDIDNGLLEQLFSIYQPQYLYCRKTREMECTKYRTIYWKNHVLWKTETSPVRIHPNVALLLSTSGTTGSAKLVKLTYENLYNNAKYGCLHLNIRSGQKSLSPLPLHYAFGFSFCLWHWHCGATVLVTEDSVLSWEFHDFYMREHVSNFAATPYTWHMLRKIQFWNAEKVRFLNFAISSGAQMAEREQRTLVSVLGDRFWLGYGQTECIGIVLAANFEEGNIKIGTVGKAFKNAEVILDQDTNEMLIKSKSVCMGYAACREDLAKGDENHGVLHTGDVAEIEDGYIYLRGRLKRYVKILDKRVSLDDIGNYLENRYPDTEFACTGEDNHICIFHTDLKTDGSKEIKALMDRHMKIPVRFVSCFCVDKIPRNSSGKVAYASLKRQVREKGEDIP